jgi:hypothetical protein
LEAEAKPDAEKLALQEERIMTEVVSKFRDLETTMKSMVVDFQQADMVQDEAREGESEEADKAQDNQMQQQLLQAMAQMLAEAQATTQAAVEAIAQSRQPKQISITAPSGMTYSGMVQ